MFDIIDIEGDGVLAFLEQFGFDVEGEKSRLATLLGTAIDAAVVDGLHLTDALAVDENPGTATVGSSGCGDGQAKGTGRLCRLITLPLIRTCHQAIILSR